MIVALQGGMANQLFQYSFGISVAKARNEDVAFTRFRVDHDVKRSYALGAFNIDVPIVQREGPAYYRDGGGFNSGVYTAPPDTTFIGYWQTESYFDVPLVRSRITYRNGPSDRSLHLFSKIFTKPNTVFLHVRRGDYANEPHTQAFHGLLPMDYYDRAITYIHERVENAKFYIFSDDPDWCRQHFTNTDYNEVVGHNKPGDGNASGAEADDLWLMSHCHHGIIANSAFSWWGAWLGDKQEDRIVIAPEHWFQIKDMYSGDIVPHRWVKL